MGATKQNTIIVIGHPKGALPANPTSAKGRADLAEIARFFEACAIGMEPGKPGDTFIDVHRGPTDAHPVAAEGTVTCASVVAGNTFTIGGAEFTASAGAPGSGSEFDCSGTDAETAANLAAAINSELGSVFSAEAEGAVVTITCKQKGTIGIFITLASSGATLTLSGSTLEGGVGGNASTVRSWEF